MTAYIDRRLTNQIKAAGDSRPVEAVIVVKEREGLSHFGESGLAQQVIEAAAERTGDQPSTVRYFPRASAAVITASGKLIQEIIKDENVMVASATDVDVIVF